MSVWGTLRWSVRLLLGGILLLAWQSCGTNPTQPPSSCTTSLDCPGSMICASSKCKTSAPPIVNVDAATDEAPGACTNDLTRDCEGGCGKGTQTCTNEAWGPCQPTSPTRPCYDGLPATQGKGTCKDGTQTCKAASSGKVEWGSCEGQVQPTKELCGDGLDNDCNGEADEKAAGCTCKAKDTQVCGKSTGACKEGSQTCTDQNEWGPCVGATEPTTEVCNDIDDNCDGKIDEDLKRECYSAKVGCTLSGTKYTCKAPCQVGSQTCTAGKWGACANEVLPQAELCRDGKDNNCDGNIDEICGAPLLWVLAEGSGKIKKKHSSKVSTTLVRNNAGDYSLTLDATHSCKSFPLFLTPHIFVTTSIAYKCNNDKFEIKSGAPYTTSGTLKDVGFTAVIPLRAIGEVWGLVDVLTCKAPLFNCQQTNSYGGATVKRAAVGIYEIAHKSCTAPERPMFTTLSAAGPLGYTSISYKSKGVCVVKVYNLSGSLTNRSFSYWLPLPSKHAWININVLNRTSFNDFGDTTTKWTANRETAGKWLDVTYPGFANPSAVLANNTTSTGPFSVVVGFTSAIKQGVRITSQVVSSTFPPRPSNLSVMFVQ